MLRSCAKRFGGLAVTTLPGTSRSFNPALPPLGTVSFVKFLAFWLVQSFEFSLDNSDARYTRYYRRGLRIRFYMIVYRLFYTCMVKGYSTGLQQWCDWRGYKGANLPPSKINKNLSPYFVYISVCSIVFLVLSKLLFYAFFGSFWTVVVFGWFRVLVQYIEIHIRIHFYL